MTEPAIRTVGLGKQYKLGAHLRYYTLRDSLTYALTAPVRAAVARSRGERRQ